MKNVELKNWFSLDLVLLFGVMGLLFVIQDVARLPEISIWYEFRNGFVISLSIIVFIFICIIIISNVMIYDHARTSKLKHKLKISDEKIKELEEELERHKKD